MIVCSLRATMHNNEAIRALANWHHDIYLFLVNLRMIVYNSVGHPNLYQSYSVDCWYLVSIWKYFSSSLLSSCIHHPVVLLHWTSRVETYGHIAKKASTMFVRKLKMNATGLSVRMVRNYRFRFTQPQLCLFIYNSVKCYSSVCAALKAETKVMCMNKPNTTDADCSVGFIVDICP